MWHRSYLATLLLLPSIAFGQSVQQSGSVTPGHVPVIVTNGVIGDGGTPTSGKLTGLGITASGPSFCISSDFPTAAGWQQFCFGVTTANGAQISVQNFGTAAPQGISYLINGTTSGIPLVVGLPTTANDTVCFSNTTGSLKDCGFSPGNVNGPASSTAGHVATFADGTGKLLADGGAVGATTLTGDISGGPSVGTVATTLATVNSNVGTFGGAANHVSITVDGKGRITAASSVTPALTSFSQIAGTIALGQLPTLPLTSLAAQSNSTVLANNTGGASTPVAITPSALLDIIGGTQGQILYRDASGWLALAPGSPGQLLTTNGGGANPVWTTAIGTGSVTNVSTGNGLTGGPVTTTGTVSVDVSYMQGFIGGLVMSTDVSSPQTVIDSAKGAAASDDATYFMKAGAFTKNTNAAWAVGAATGCLDSGTGLVLSTWYHLYVIARTDTGVVDELCSMAPPFLSQAAGAISNASPAVITLAAHGLQIGQPIRFTTTGGLPTGLTVGTQYWVIAAGFTTGQFEVSASCSGTGCSTGTAVNTSSAGSGTHSVITAPIFPANYTVKRRIGSFKTDASVHILPFTQNNDEFLWVTGITDASGISIGNVANTSVKVSIPPGVKTNAVVFGNYTNATVGAGFRVVSPDVTSGAANALFVQVTNQTAGGYFNPRSDTSGQIAVSGNTAGGSYSLITQGYVDSRGKSN